MPILGGETFGKALGVCLSITSAKVQNKFEICKQIPDFNIWNFSPICFLGLYGNGYNTTQA